MAELEQRDNVFSKLKKLFSSDIVVRNVGGRQLKVIDWNRYQQLGNMKTNSLVDKYTRLHRFASSAGGAYSAVNYETMRTQIYADYEAMDTESIIASTLDIISDECTLKNEAGEILQIRSADENIQRILYNLFYDVLNVEFNLWMWIRSMCKYGDFYLHLEIDEKFGIYNVTPLSPYDILRKEGDDPDNPTKVTFVIDPAAVAGGGYSNSKMRARLDNYEVTHFRLLTDSNLLPYGRSYIEPARKTFKQYVLMKDAMLLHRIVRAPEKRINYINVGSIPPNEVDAYMQKLMAKMKKTPFVDPSTGEYNLRFNVQNMMEDIYVPVRGNDQTTKIDTLKGLEYNAIDDVHFLRDEMLSALKVPKAYFGFDKDLCIAPDTLIPLLDGRELMVSQIIDEFKQGIKNYVYSIDENTNNIVPGEIEWAGYTRLNTDTIKVWLDNDEFIQCTPDHLFLTRDNQWIEAQNLNEGQSLMPLYLQKSTNKKINGYNEVYNPSTGKYEYVHRLVANYYNLKKDNKVIHHSDCNKLNNNPENLDCSMDFWEHRNYHIDHTRLCHTSEANAKRIQTYDILMENEDFAKNRKNIGKENSKLLAKWIQENGASRKGFVKNPIGICKGCGNNIDKTIIEVEKRQNQYCSKECKIKNWKSKYREVDINILLEEAKTSPNFTILRNRLGIKDSTTFKKCLEYNNISKSDLIIYYMDEAHRNPNFMNQFPETSEFYNNIKNQISEYKNHKVLRIEIVENKIDTCDLTIKQYHNFGTKVGVIIHNSGKATLASEDIRFARTVERIQRIVLSELYQMALTQLYIQGYDGSSLTNFELNLTTPSIIYEQEKIALYKEKMGLAKDMLESKIIPSDYIYDNLFQFSDEQVEEFRDLVIEDQKRIFRLSQIENEGNDPAHSGKSYGTPHDLAALYGAGRMGQSDSSSDLPAGFDEKEPVGRPVNRDSLYGTQDSNLGKDPIGSKEATKPHQLDQGSGTPKGNQFLIGVNEYLKHRDKLKSIPKELVFKKSTLLSEVEDGNIKE